MQILLASSKTMKCNPGKRKIDGTVPAFQSYADNLAGDLAGYSAEDLKLMMKLTPSLARITRQRYEHFFNPENLSPAIFSYNGTAYRELKANSMNEETLSYANSHLFIGSFLYGLLRPFDLIKNYRLEGNVELKTTGYDKIFNFWKPILTDWFISEVKADDGVLVNLASSEFKNLFHWKRIENELDVITPEFRMERDGKMRTVAVFAKMCRGAMTRWILNNRITNPDELKTFEFQGFINTSGYVFEKIG